jgi:hypothetical protein
MNSGQNVLSNPTFPRDILITPMIIMVENGVPITTFVDVGSADGTFGLTVLDAINAGIQIVNLDAQDVYEDSLRRIAAMIGGHYFIGAVGDHDGASPSASLSMSIGCRRRRTWVQAAAAPA